MGRTNSETQDSEVWRGKKRVADSSPVCPRLRASKRPTHTIPTEKKKEKKKPK
jgi:hypothetical protein